MALQIIPDTNFLIYAAKYKIDLEAELSSILSEKFEIILLDIVREEIVKHAKSAGLKKHEASLALKILVHLERRGVASEIETPEGAKNADQALIRLDSKDNVIATMDRRLKTKLKHSRILSVRQKTHLQFI
jgi:rRNA-processing protein FCF1